MVERRVIDNLRGGSLDSRHFGVLGGGGRSPVGVLLLLALAALPIMIGAIVPHAGNGFSFSNPGGGWEYMLDTKWSLKGEYLYLGFDKNITTTGNFTGAPVQEFTTTKLSGIHTGKVGLNYKWDWLSFLR